MNNVAKKNAYETIKECILYNKIIPGEKISERSIAEELGFSRVPVREAFQRLILEGLLVNTPGRGIHLREYNSQDICDLYAYREALDGMAARYCAMRAEKMEIGYLKIIFKEMQDIVQKYNVERWREKDIEFHRTIAYGSRNNRIIQTLGNILQECFYLSRTSFEDGDENSDQPPAYIQEVIEEHKKILDAISSGDEDLAEKRARESVQKGLERGMEKFIADNRNRLTFSRLKRA